MVFVAESVLAPPGPIPNPVVTQGSAGEYCGGDPVGGEAAADTTAPLAQATGIRRQATDPAARHQSPAAPGPISLTIAAGWSSGSSLGS